MSLDHSTLPLYTGVHPMANIGVYSFQKEFCIARIPLWERSYTESNTVHCQASGIRLLCASENITVEWVTKVSQ